MEKRHPFIKAYLIVAGLMAVTAVGIAVAGDVVVYEVMKPIDDAAATIGHQFE